ARGPSPAPSARATGPARGWPGFASRAASACRPRTRGSSRPSARSRARRVCSSSPPRRRRSPRSCSSSRGRRSTPTRRSCWSSRRAGSRTRGRAAPGCRRCPPPAPTSTRCSGCSARATGLSFTDSLGVAFLGADAPRHVAGWARAAEGAGLGSVWLIEDYFYPGAFALAGAAAAVTERAVVGIGVVNPYTRHPALLAMETATLAGLAPGRVVLGLGTSNRVWIEERMGIPFTAPLESVRECVEIVRRLLAGERLTFRGQRFAVDGVALESAPTRDVPIFLGVKGPKALRLAGEIADGVHCAILASPAHVRREREMARAARGAGARAGTPGEFRRALARWSEAGLDTVIAVVPRETYMLEQLALIGAELSPHWKEIRCR